MAVILFNTVAFLTVKKLTKSKILHMAIFTILFHLIVDLFLSYKYQGYWYFNKEIEWLDIPAITLLSPAAILMFLDRYPFRKSFFKRILHIIFWSVLIVMYEAVSLLPEPWGYFRYGWWKLGYSALVYPILFSVALLYYNWVLCIEEKENRRSNP